MKENKLSVFTYPYRKTYYLTHPWKLFKDIYWNIRNFIHRGRYGYAYVDVWNFCDWYPQVAAEALRYLAKHNSGYPGVYPWTTMKEWRAYLEYLANRLERCANCQDILFGEERNEYGEDFHNMMERTRIIETDGHGQTVWRHELTPEEEALRDKYFAREKEIRLADELYIIETYRWLAEDLQRLWD